jgi:hypothetical protein
MAAKWKIGHSEVYFFGLSLIVIALPLSKFLMSIGQFVLVINWLIEAQYRRKIREIFHNKAVLALISFYVLHLIGLIYTTDFEYALKDLRIKLPLFALPVIIATTPALSRSRFRLLMMLFIAAVLAGTFISSYILAFKQIIDIREISMFISHIRFSLNIDIAIFTLLYFILKDKEISHPIKIIQTAILIWFIVFLFLFESMTGLSVLLITGLIILIIYILKKSNFYYLIGFLVLLITIGIISFITVRNISKEVFHVNKVDFKNLEEKSSRGNYYEHDTLRTTIENGSYVWIYISMKEMREAWNKRSAMDFDSLDKKEQKLSYTLIRFLTSKGLRKDKDGVNSLTDEEIKMVERGIANIKYSEKSSLRSRIHKIIWGYKNVQETSNPSGHSLLQRFEFWRASFGIIKRNPIVGVGTGDMNLAFDEQYERMKSPLEEKYQWRSHNQFLSIFVGFGIIGLLWFLFSLIYPPLILRKFNDYYYLTFFIIAILSMLTEDTIESQAGVTFFAFFNCLFLFGKKNN